MQSPQIVKVFQDCIRVADPSVGQFLTVILGELQVHSARLESTYNSFSSQSIMLYDKLNYMSYLYCVGLLRARTDKLFDFARGESEFDSSALTIKDLKTAYHLMKIYPEFIDGLMEFSGRCLNRAVENNT